MATTAFQYVFDNATSISINKRPVSTQTISRDLTVRTLLIGYRKWRFDVRLPDGLPWDKARPYIEGIERADRATAATVSMNNAGYNSWFMNYQGSASTTAGFVVTATNGIRALTITACPTMTSGYAFKAGDLIQLGSGSVYTVELDVPYNATTFNVSRIVVDPSGSYNLTVGPACTFNVICTVMPQWTIFARNQVAWSGPFSFMEY